jgi:hypothetical protein
MWTSFTKARTAIEEAVEIFTGESDCILPPPPINSVDTINTKKLTINAWGGRWHDRHPHQWHLVDQQNSMGSVSITVGVFDHIQGA